MKKASTPSILSGGRETCLLIFNNFIHFRVDISFKKRYTRA